MVRIECPKCGTQLHNPESGGPRVRCRRCGAMLLLASKPRDERKQSGEKTPSGLTRLLAWLLALVTFLASMAGIGSFLLQVYDRDTHPSNRQFADDKNALTREKNEESFTRRLPREKIELGENNFPSPEQPVKNGHSDEKLKLFLPNQNTPKKSTPMKGPPTGGVDAAESLRKHFAEIPKMVVAEARTPTGKDYDEPTGRIRLDVVMRVDKKKYDAFVTAVVPLLDNLSQTQSSFHVIGEPSGSRSFIICADAPGTSTHISERLVAQDDRFTVTQFNERHPNKWTLAVLSHIDSTSMRSKWKAYVLDNDKTIILSDLEGEFTVEILFIDTKGELLSTDSFKCANTLWCGWRERWTEFGRRDSGTLFSKLAYESTKGIDGVPLVGIAPLCFDSINSYVPSVVYRRELTLTGTDFARLKEVQCKIIFRAN